MTNNVLIVLSSGTDNPNRTTRALFFAMVAHKEGKKTGSALNYLIEPLDSWDPLPISTKMIPITILHLGILVLDFIVFILGVVIFLAVFMMVILPYAAPLLFVTNSAFRSAVSGVIANYIGL